MQLLQHWVDTMLGNFIATFADRRFLKSKPHHVIEEFGDCNKKAINVPMQAKCLSRLIKNELTGRKYLNQLRLEKYRKLEIQKSFQKRQPKRAYGFHSRLKDVVTRNDYELMSPTKSEMLPLGKVAHALLKSVLAAKNKTHTQPWQETVERIGNIARRRKETQKRLEDESLENMDQFVYRGMRSRGMIKENLETVINDPAKLKRWITKKRSEKSKEPMQKVIGLLRQGLKIGYSLAGKNSSDVDDKTLKLVSPRFLSVVPEDEERKNETMEFLSPSLFSLHDKGKGIENLTSLPNLIKGFSQQDQQKWMDLIMEAAGVVDEVENIETSYKNPKTAEEMRRRYEIESRTKDGTPLYFTRENVTKMFGSFEDRKIETFMNLHKSFSKEQVKELNHTGFFMMTREQLRMLYGSQSPYNNSEALSRLSNFHNSSHMEEHIINDVHRMAQLQSFQIRQKDIVLSPTFFTWLTLVSDVISQPIVLSPIVFSPIVLSPVVLGPLVLSPLLFSPVVLSPRILAPSVLAPLGFSPLILSPIVLHPIILSPGIFVPIVLSPMVLSPFILSPQVFTPFILSPWVLNPIILSPCVGCPLVLNPYVLSPLIWSPQALGGLILSPYVLSPVVQSALVFFTIVLSPSWLS
ncbi:moulting cycle domain-containing protein [Ditylenchus destructor]|uniref:Moulting cycle domain-containing protein n=1 Tax=Ditylenchus destructor TaxID=166010 RepID=A0AAD4MXH5_9BILA|nr:moulting cycle domain-containing protein [Ditylenchus destructor]